MSLTNLILIKSLVIINRNKSMTMSYNLILIISFDEELRKERKHVVDGTM